MGGSIKTLITDSKHVKYVGGGGMTCVCNNIAGMLNMQRKEKVIVVVEDVGEFEAEIVDLLYQKDMKKGVVVLDWRV